MKLAIPSFDGMIFSWKLAKELVIVENGKIKAVYPSKHPYDDIEIIKKEKVDLLLLPDAGYAVKELLDKEGIKWKTVENGTDVYEFIQL